MKSVQETIERKLSGLLGTPVTFEQFKISPLTGSLEVRGVTIAGDDSSRPLLSAARISALIAVAKVLAGQLAIKSLLIEGPVISLMRRRDGSFNFPCRPAAMVESKRNTSDGWRLDAQSIRVVNAQVHFEDHSGQSGYSASAEQINGELKQSAGRIEFDFSIGSIGRRDPVVELGPLKLTGQIEGADLIHSPIRATLKFADGLRLSMDSPALPMITRLSSIFSRHTP
jgi:hypothetical protein